MSRSPSRSSLHLEPPRKSVELHDPGASGLESSEDDYFSDASEGRRRRSRPQTPVSPIPITRVEKVDDEPSYGQVPGTAAYDKRRQDAVPDEIEVVPEGVLSKRNSRQLLEPPVSPGGSVIPRTVVEKVDPGSPSFGEVPGTEAYTKRLADAPPDVILNSPDPGKGLRYREDTGHRRTLSGNIIPETVVTKVDDQPAHGEVENTRAADLRKKDASPDAVEIKGDIAGSPTLDRFVNNGTMRRRSTMQSMKIEKANDSNDFGDDFDDFEEGAEAEGDDDFGDFGDGFQEQDADQDITPHNEHPRQPPMPSFPLIDFEDLSGLPDLLSKTQLHLDTMFPTTTLEHLASLSEPQPIPSDSPVFPTERSRSLWKQLVTPPPLQPPNWTQSRIRRLFLISLGVPVDLDEILPPSKQKKLILPGLEHTSESADGKNVLSRLRSQNDNASSASLAESNTSSQPSGSTKPKSKSRSNAKQVPLPPPLDLPYVKRLCATTDEKLDNFTDQEIQDHVKELESLTEKTSEVLEYWLKRRDGLRKEKEAFDGVIQNLVRHMNRVRK